MTNRKTAEQYFESDDVEEHKQLARQLAEGVMDEPYTWIVKIQVHPRWVADGFDLTDDRLRGILEKVFDFAYEHEFAGKVIDAPDPKEIRQEQGYAD